MKYARLLAVAVAAPTLVAGIAGTAARAQPATSAATSATAATAPVPKLATLDYGLRARALAAGVYVVEGRNDDFSIENGCNIINTGFIVTGAGVVVVNTGPSRRYGEQLRALIARTTTEPVVQVVHLNLHPDYFLGNQAFADARIGATVQTRAGMQREAKSYEDNLYRLCGDWMKGTEAVLPNATLGAGPWRIGGREFELRELTGHTDSDLVLIDRQSGVAFVGGLVFVDRIPTTPHARIAPWLASLDALAALPGIRQLVQSHGPVVADRRGIEQTRAYLLWLDRSFSTWARAGWEMNEVLRGPVPEVYRGWAAFKTEYVRNIAHLYPQYEQEALAR
jgi:quinoprotein relay system zinc metallohydrolase 1